LNALKTNSNAIINAEIIHTRYKTIREAAGETYIIGCNTISHLSAGSFELNRIGDDTSSLKWGTTLKMDVNTLAFREIASSQRYAHVYFCTTGCNRCRAKNRLLKNTLKLHLNHKNCASR
jgi:hypothetical protein